jgi:hypothetical protein
VQAIVRRVLAILAVGAAAATVAPAASASISPTVVLDQSAGTQAGSAANLGMDLTFAPSSGDSPKDLTLSLPPGLLANASIDGGACLHTVQPIAACQVGTGQATATLLGLPVTLKTSFDLVGPPKPGDLAGLVTMVTFAGSTMQLGSPGEITIRPSSDPAGLGVNIAFTNLPNTFSGLSISLQELKSTFNGLRLPTSCPASPVSIAVAADSYADPAQRTTSAPLHVTGCSQLAFSPQFHVTAVKDAHDNGVQLSTDLTQPPGQATARTVTLTLPNRVVASNFGLVSHGILCANPSSSTCKTIGSATATSPLYPTPLRGNVYLIGKVTSSGLAGAPGLSIVFPAPFALTLTGTVDIGAGSTTFENVPDIPQSDLNVMLTGGANSAFVASCSPASGTASSTLTSQNGDKTAVASAPFTVSGCPAPKPGKAGRPKIGSASLSGLARGAPTLRFRLLAGARAPKLRSFAVALPPGLRFAGRRAAIAGVSVGSAKPRSLALVHGRLVVTLRATTAATTVTIGPRALQASAALQKTAKRHRLGSLRLVVSIKDAVGASTTAMFRIKHPR